MLNNHNTRSSGVHDASLPTAGRRSGDAAPTWRQNQLSIGMKIYTKTGDGGESSLYGGTRLPKSDLRFEAYGTIDVGAELALAPGQESKAALVGIQETAKLEQRLDEMQAELPELKNFILPGGSALGASLHHARTVARRAERAVVRLSGSLAVRPELLAYLNRLSDYLFVLARYVNFKAGVEEKIWRS
ncbi:MAG: ATP-cobalamin adenosyltransferase [Parcubacteria group bacterium GW2011_GWA2_42_80]|nr:MAG: ATP-cobalamin adenosyltransferase [Parcubacteria group bacterium GW2011_GWA2_42_80]